MIIATAGHVDHGKTALVRALTGIDTDTLVEEKRRGLTIETGFAYCDLGPTRVGFVDVPGHHQFIHNMLCGFTGIDAVMLVVAADEGIMPQTIEHLRIMELLEVENALLVISKMDCADPEISAILESELEIFVRGTCLEHAPIIPTAAPVGKGIETLRRQIADVAMRIPPRSISGHFRMAIDRCFTLKGIGVVVTGFVHAGSARVNDELVLAPEDVPARVRGIHSNDAPAPAAETGQRCAVNLGGVALATTHRGQWLTNATASKGTRRVGVRLSLPADANHSLSHWTPIHLFHGASHVTGRVALCEDRPMQPGQTQLAQLVLDDPVVAVRGDRCVLRNQACDETLAGATVLDIFTDRRGYEKSARLKRLRAMENPDPMDCLNALMCNSSDGVDIEKFRINWNMTSAELTQIIDKADGFLVSDRDGFRIFDPSRWQELSDEVRRKVCDWNKQHPESAGIRLNELRQTIGQDVATKLLQSVLDALVRDGEIRQSGPAFHLPDFRPGFSPKNLELWKIARDNIANCGIRPPTVEELAYRCDFDIGETLSLLQQAASMNLVVQIEPNRFFLPQTLRRLAHKLAKLAQSSADGRATTAAYRDEAGLGRNLTISVLEHFDAIHFTRRVGNSRCLIQPVDVVFDDRGLVDRTA